MLWNNCASSALLNPLLGSSAVAPSYPVASLRSQPENDSYSAMFGLPVSFVSGLIESTMMPYSRYAASTVFLNQMYWSASVATQVGRLQRRRLTCTVPVETFWASAASWKPGSRCTFGYSARVRIVAAWGPVEVLRSLPISILTVFMIGLDPPKSVWTSCQYLSGCCDL